VLYLHLSDEAATLRLGALLATALEAGMRIYLSGDLGTGKTTFARGLLRGLGYSGRAKSPSYALVESYVISRLYLYHFDFYRFNSPKEWTDSGFDELFDSDAVCLVEWPDKAEGLLPQPDLTLRFSLAAQGRDVTIEARGQKGERCGSVLKSYVDSS
jgi:tRNA threonylcarbamoyladenosine biosynthesis protein TsaE